MPSATLIPPVSLLRLFFRMGGWVSLILGLVLLGMTVSSIITYNKSLEFAEHGRWTTATITDLGKRRVRNQDGGYKTEYWVTFDYPAGGKTYDKRRTVSRTFQRAHPIGTDFEILYLPHAPKSIEMNEGSNARSAVVTRWMGLVFGIAWLIALYVSGNWAVQATKARTHGRALKAKVTEITKTKLRKNNSRRYRLKWRDEDGETGTSLVAKESAFDASPVGTEIVVFKRNGTSWWAGDVGNRPARETPIPDVKN